MYNIRYSVLACLMSLLVFEAYSQEPQTHQIYNKQKEAVSFVDMTADLSNYDVVLFGEFHDNAIIHWLQLKTTEALYRNNQNLVLGAEMFETDNQLILDEYLQGNIATNRFEDEMRLWTNYKTDYKPLVEFAKTNQLKFIATNVPRRYATLVSKQGMQVLDSLSEEAKSYFPSLPIKVDTITPGYAEMLDMMKGHGMDGDPMNFVAAQAIKDATMAHFVAQNLPSDGVFLHFNGDYHSKHYGGIYWYLKNVEENQRTMQKDLNIAIIAVFQDPEEVLEFPKDETIPATYSIVVPASFTKTH